MKQVLIQEGKVIVEEVPAPPSEAGNVLVQVHYSCISSGTEVHSLRVSSTPLWQRALKEPEKVKRAIDLAREKGIKEVLNTVKDVQGSARPAGYSAAGRVIAVGKDVNGLNIGDVVACAGAQYAHHAEIISVPRNLVVPVPEGAEIKHASTVALGAIAMQGVRRAMPTLGETFVVIGLGLIGQLTAQLLKVNGCHVIGIDPRRDRRLLAEKFDLDALLNPEEEYTDHVARLTHGRGADGVIVTAASESSEILSGAFNACRKKGRVVVVGDIGLHIQRTDIYARELDFYISTSYGPGRYDPHYEAEGKDYPIGYVRWTENRNMEEYLNLLAQKTVDIEPLIAKIVPIEQAEKAYQTLKEDDLGGSPLLLIAYADQKPERAARTYIENPKAQPSLQGALRLALIGAGEFARAVHLPNLEALSASYSLRSVVSRTGHQAASIAKRYGAVIMATDYHEVLRDNEVDAVLISTRHHLHAPIMMDALRVGKHVLVEKPLVLHRQELAEIESFYQNAGQKPVPIVMTGFNRRFSPLAQQLQQLAARRRGPMVINYRVNAGYIPLDHWVHGEQGGGRNIGEACHFYDFFTFLANAKANRIEARSVAVQEGYYSRRDNFVVTVSFEDGTLATLTYTALGSKRLAKERIEIFFDGVAAVLDDFRVLEIAERKLTKQNSKIIDKGHRHELEAFAAGIKNKSWPIPLWQQLQASEISFAVEEQLGQL